MKTATKPRSLFGHQLRAELSKQDVSVRELGRRMHRAKPSKWKDASSAWRSVRRWIVGTSASTENRREVAAALGLDRDHFGTADGDDEEAELFADLSDALAALVRQQVRKATERAS